MPRTRHGPAARRRDQEPTRLLPTVAGFREADDSLLGIVISHPHQDHYGLARHVRPEVPVYIGAKRPREVVICALGPHWHPDLRTLRHRD